MKEPYQGTEWSRGVLDMADAVRENRPQRITGAQAAHVVEILSAIRTSYEQGVPVQVFSQFSTPSPMDWVR